MDKQGGFGRCAAGAGEQNTPQHSTAQHDRVTGISKEGPNRESWDTDTVQQKGRFVFTKSDNTRNTCIQKVCTVGRFAARTESERLDGNCNPIVVMFLFSKGD